MSRLPRRNKLPSQRVKHEDTVYNIDVVQVLKRSTRPSNYAVIHGMEMEVWPVRGGSYEWTTDQEEFEARIALLGEGLVEGTLSQPILKKKKGKHSRDKRWDRKGGQDGRVNIDRNSTH